MTFSLFFQSLINGLNQGAIYALIALGYTMVYGIIRMINFAHGDFIMIGAYTLFYTIPLMVNAGMPTLVGINVNKIITTTFAIGSGLAAVAALMYCATYPRVTNDMGSMMGMKAFIAAVLGGIGIIPGAMLGGILIGLIEIFVKLFAPGWYEAVTYGTLIVILLVKPSGILGKNVGEKV